MAIEMVYADGKVDYREKKWINKFFTDLGVDEKTIEKVIQHIMTEDAESYLRSLQRELSYNQKIMSLAMLYQAANIDGHIDEKELEVMHLYFNIFGIDPKEFVSEIKQLI